MSKLWLLQKLFIDMCQKVFFEENFDKIHVCTFPSLLYIFQLDRPIFDYFLFETNFDRNFCCDFNEYCLLSIKIDGSKLLDIRFKRSRKRIWTHKWIWTQVSAKLWFSQLMGLGMKELETLPWRSSSRERRYQQH